MPAYRLTRRGFLVLLLGAPALPACTTQPPTQTEQPTPPAAAATATAAPTPTVVAVTWAEKANELARHCLQAWEGRDFGAMYDTLSAATQQAIPRDKFVGRYQAISDGVGLTQLTSKIDKVSLTPETGTPGKADVAFTVTMQTAEVGQIVENNTLPLVLEGEKWRVAWTPDLIFRDLAGDRVVRVDSGGSARAAILDRKGRVLAGPGSVLEVGLVPGKIKDEAKVLQAVSAFLGTKPEDIKKKYEGQPLDWWVPLAEYPESKRPEAQAKLGGLEGVELRAKAARVYPLGPAAAHVLGYLSQVTADDLQRLAGQGYAEGVLIGRAGIEAWAERDLAGQAGGKVYIADAAGNTVRVVAERKGKPGAPVQLTIDLDLQQRVDKILGDKTGSIVMLDPRDNSILAMVSRPSFDPNAFITGISASDWQKLSSDPKHPFQNRPVASAYPTGSIFKVITMDAALEKGGFRPDTPFECNGTWTGLPGVKLGDWLQGGHGRLDLAEGLVRSCDIVFYELAKKLDSIDPNILPEFSRQFGLGAPTGIVGLEEVKGTIPDPAWKQQTLRQPWYAGDTVNLAIGQGYMEATPLQMANLYAALANGGELRTPLLVRKVGEGAEAKQFTAQSVRRVPGSAATLSVIREAMKKVASTPKGTAYYAFKGYSVPTAAKTGSAENQNPDAHAWFAGYAPADKPEVVVLVMVEGGKMGGEVAAPLGRQALEAYFGLPR